MKTFQKILSIIALIPFILGIIGVDRAEALITSYGGHSRTFIPCTGEGSNVESANFFYPLYLNSVIPIGGFMGVPYVPPIFSYFYIYPLSWAIGHYTPGAATCVVGKCPYCTFIANYGMILPFTGTSMPAPAN